ncbi:MAG: XRE family transcriptional regulator [Salinibacter sp.]|uniref:helix-turn-helix domain-containing protein n=1 Tax=Salinibacter sp. TaxID=2065818 RepID=UPI002FC2860D
MSLVGARIKQARRRAKWSQHDLAAEVDVSATTISKYERGLSKPGSEVLMQIADALDLDVSFFLRPKRVGTIEPAYRKLSSLNKGDERQLTERIRDWLERYLEAEEIVEPEPAAFESPTGFPYPVDSMGEAEAAATVLREKWDLGTDPIEDMTVLLEDHGIRAGVVEADDDFDACTFRTEINGDVPVVVTRKGVPGDRQRSSLAHELGHLVLDVAEEVDTEDACNRFAGALLAPEPAIREAVGESERRKITLDELHVLKHRFGISMQALFFRLRDLQIISDAAATEARRDFRKRGWHEEEPGEPVEPEEPERFHLLVLRAFAEGLIGEKRARELYGGPIADLESDLQPVA